MTVVRQWEGDCFPSPQVEELRRRVAALVQVARPFVHAAAKAMRRDLWDAYATFVAAYRDAAEKLRGGGPDPPRFPAGCFPSALSVLASNFGRTATS